MRKVVNDTIWRETLAEALSVAGNRRFWMGLVAFALVVGLTGPFGTYDTMPALVRMAYWLVVVTATCWLGYLVSFAFASWAENRGFVWPVSTTIGAVAASVPVTALLAGLHAIAFALSFWADVLRLFPYVTAITMAAALLSEGLAMREIEPRQSTTPPARPVWLDQLPAHLGRDLILLQAQDHYIRVVTELGETLIRSGLDAAASDLGEIGVRIHRSWWVARRAVVAYRYQKGAPVVVLRNGLQLPVGRTYRRSVREALQ